MGETEEFNTLAFEKKLSQLKDTQESIQSLSSWCLKQRPYHKKIVSSWLNVLKRVKVEQRLVLFYLANDVIQYSKRKNYEFVESWGLNLQKATPLVRDEKVRPKILRIFKIWEQRSVYDDEFLSDLTGLLSAGAVKKTDDDPLDFQPQQLVNKIKQCSVLEADTQLKLKCVHDSTLDFSDMDVLGANLKDRSIKDDVEKELNEGVQCVERYSQALQREIVAREALLALLSSATQYYSTQRGEVKVVAYAYKNFGARVRALKRKLDELLPTLPSAPSPPQRDEDVPSPGPDEDLDLPNTDNDVSYNIDQTFNTSISADGSLYNLGLSSFLNDNALTLFNETEMELNNANKIEVINTRPSDKQDFDISDILKNFEPLDNVSTSSKNSANSVHIQSDTLPGLDLLTDSGNPPPPTSFYGTMETITIPDESEQPYLPEAVVTTNQWNNAVWNVPIPSPAARLPARSVFAEPPASPPREHAQELVGESRSRLPPPPPPPALPGLTHIEDVDHRLLPNLPPAPVPPPVRHSHQGVRREDDTDEVSDVDHRNLISLTQLPPRHVSVDQDYRVLSLAPPPVPPLVSLVAPLVPPLVPPLAPSDIVESVDMDLSEDEEQQGMYQSQNQTELRHNSFNNNKVLVGGGKVNHKDNTNLIQINSNKREPPPGAPPGVPPGAPPGTLPVAPLTNPFDNMPPALRYNMPFQSNYQKKFDEKTEHTSDVYEEDSRASDRRNQSPEFEDFNDNEWQQHRPYMNRFPRNWGPRSNYRAPYNQFNQRSGPRQRWMGPRPQRFW